MTNHHTSRCSHNQTDDSLTALGYPVLKVDKCVGMTTVVREGTSREAALHAAWCAGLVQICTNTGRDALYGNNPEPAWSANYTTLVTV